MLGTQCKLINIDPSKSLKGDGNAAEGNCYTDLDKYVGRCNKKTDNSEIVNSSLVTIQTQSISDTLAKCRDWCTYTSKTLKDPCTAYDFSSSMCRTFTMDNGLAKDRVVLGSGIVSEGQCHQIPIPQTNTEGSCVNSSDGSGIISSKIVQQSSSYTVA